jgi:hypothetical protein
LEVEIRIVSANTVFLLAPKTYILVFEDGSIHLRMKGFSGSAREYVDFDKMLALLLGNVEELKTMYSNFDKKQEKMLRKKATNFPAPSLILPIFQLGRTLTGKVFERKNATKTLSFKFTKRELLYPDQIIIEPNTPSLRFSLEHILSKTIRSLPWGY